MIMHSNAMPTTQAPILTDFSAAALAAALDSNAQAFFAALAATPDAIHDHTQRYHRWINPGILSPMFNGVIGVNLAASAVDDFIQETKEYFKSNRVPLSFWWVTPGSQPADLGSRFAAHGMIPYEVAAPGMAVDLNHLAVELPTPDGFQIATVNDEESLQVWARTFVETFEAPEFAGQAWVQASQRIGLDRLPWRLYIGWLADKPVGISLSFCGGGAASLWALGVKPTMRRSGIGAALTIRPMLDAARLGYRIGVLFATELGVPLYERLGYRTYCTVSRYLWRDE
ncbi:MAG: GNAT family N-acetyltransferase [Anaerolineae bacterium]